MAHLFLIKCHKILDYPKQKKPVETVAYIQIEEAFVGFIEHKVSKILILVINGDKGSLRDKSFKHD
tara:strand:+ start:169 stop:366 length:198 start_codon:yes stop_codon:yes gene_type:complete